MAHGKVITTHLKTGDPAGIRIITISNKTCQLLVFPRAELDAVKKMSLAMQPTSYILLGERESDSDADSKPTQLAYIGESINGADRVDQHDKDTEKLFWNKCLMFVTGDNSLDKADIEFLESRMIACAKECDRIALTNKNDGKTITLSDSRTDVMEEFLDDCKLLASFVGCPIFEKGVAKKKSKENTVFFYERGCQATGIFNETDNSITVLKGSKLPVSTADGFRYKIQRQEWLSQYATLEGDMWVVDKNYYFPNPGNAAKFCGGGSINGWDKWKREDGKTLKQIYDNK